MNSVCPEAGWNPIELAPELSQLAGVLAGFVFTGLVVMLSQSWPKRRRIPAMGLFVATFAALALDSYLFAVVAGETPTVGSACYRVWSETLLASGLLAVGSVALTGGIVWLIAAHLEQDEGRDSWDSAIDLGRLARSVLHGMTALACVLLSTTTLDYLHVSFATRPPTWLIASVHTYLVAILAIIGLIRLRQRRTTASAASLARQLSKGTFGAVRYALVVAVALGLLLAYADVYWSPRRCGWPSRSPSS
ncbi:hypothetical protein [Nonomuraea aurantiaca]|uniref:hypothetical protein n=1 Tax=Nonomuraea aurantiaca TaxID=2878562 RepID=UPI001CD9BCC6|nr:hypothetical protein [Nonomuraea aurantiaca]MCA2221593.1 hypothetical protein [Nonomuraea aurantiaca]